MSKDILITSGDPAGCGPFITLKAIEQCLSRKLNFFVVGDQKIFKKIPRYQEIKNRFSFIDINIDGINKIKSGYPSKLSGYAALSYIKQGLEIMKERKIARLVTAPLSKEAVQMTHPGFKGHTEYLAHHFRIDNFAMMMFSKKIKLVLLTRHVSLNQISRLITEKTVNNGLSLAYSFLQKKCRIDKPRIALVSLNPHAGKHTFLGKEEEIILRVAAKFKKVVYGPYPADTVFTSNVSSNFDCFICGYHDQGMIPFKLLAMNKGTNITLGLPIIRTSPAHGVAYEAIRMGRTLFDSSMLMAINTAAKLDLS